MKVGRLYNTIEEKIPDVDIQLVDPRNHLTIIHYFWKQVKNNHIPIRLALKHMLASIKEGNVFADGHLAGELGKMDQDAILSNIYQIITGR